MMGEGMLNRGRGGLCCKRKEWIIVGAAKGAGTPQRGDGISGQLVSPGFLVRGMASFRSPPQGDC